MIKLERTYDACGDRSRGEKRAADERICKDVLAILQHHYPSYFWVASCNSSQGILTFSIPELTNWQYLLRLQDMDTDPGFKKVVRGAGEFLERYKIPRSNIDMGMIYDFMKNNPIAHRLAPPQ